MSKKASLIILASVSCLVVVGLLVGPLSSGTATGQEAATYKGSDKCKSCHQEQHKAFMEMKHAHAFDALTAEQVASGKDEKGRACVSCHTTGYGQEGGFTSVADTPNLTNVGCESCHGAGSIHVKTMLAAMMEEATVADKHISKNVGCAGCHNPHISYKKLYGAK